MSERGLDEQDGKQLRRKGGFTIVVAEDKGVYSS